MKVNLKIKYTRVMDGLESNDDGFSYKLDKINILEKWNTSVKELKYDLLV